MAKKEKTKQKISSGHRSNIKKEREERIRQKQKINQKRKLNLELFTIVNTENIDKLDTKSKIEMINQLYNLISQFPEQNFDKLELLQLFLHDKEIKILIKTIKLLTLLYLDVMPSYKIRIDKENSKNNNKNNEGSNNISKGKNLSQETENLQNYEKALLKNYENFISILEIYLKTHSKNLNLLKLQEFSLQSLAELFEKFYLFNFEEKLLLILTEKLCCNINKNLRQIAFEALKKVLSVFDNSSNMLKLKLNIIKQISHYVFVKDHSYFDSKVLDLFCFHKIELPDLKELDKKIDLSDLKFGAKEQLFAGQKHKTKEQNKIEKREKKKFEQEKSKIIKQVKKEFLEYENFNSPKQIYYLNLKILKKILLVYFFILKQKRDSPLMPSVFEGIGVLSEHINVEILIDLQKNAYEFIAYILLDTNSNKRIFALTALKTCLLITEKLTKVIISIQDTNLINSVYLFLVKIKEDILNLTKDNFFNLIELVEMLLIKTRQYALDISASFIKRLALFCLDLPEKYLPAFLLLIKKVIQRYPNLASLVDLDDDYFDYKITDPMLAQGKQSNIYKEINQIKDKNINNKLIKQLCDYILKQEKYNAVFSSLSYYDLLIK